MIIVADCAPIFIEYRLNRRLEGLMGHSPIPWNIPFAGVAIGLLGLGALWVPRLHYGSFPEEPGCQIVGPPAGGRWL